MSKLSSSLALLLTGAALSIGVYLVDDSTIPAHTGKSGAGGIFEQQVLDDSVAVNPDRSETSPAFDSASASYPLRPYWPYPLGGAVLICYAFWIRQSKSGKALQNPPLAREGTTKPEKLAGCKTNDSDTAKTSIGVPAPSPQDESKNKAVVSTVPAITNEKDCQMSLKKPAVANHTMVSAERMIQLSSELRRLKQVLPEANFKAIHKLFLARDESNNLWTVDLKGKTWHQKVGGRWIPGNPPLNLYIADEFTAAIQENN